MGNRRTTYLTTNAHCTRQPWHSNTATLTCDHREPISVSWTHHTLFSPPHPSYCSDSGPDLIRSEHPTTTSSLDTSSSTRHGHHHHHQAESCLQAHLHRRRRRKAQQQGLVLGHPETKPLHSHVSLPPSLYDMVR